MFLINSCLLDYNFNIGHEKYIYTGKTKQLAKNLKYIMHHFYRDNNTVVHNTIYCSGGNVQIIDMNNSFPFSLKSVDFISTKMFCVL